MQQFWFHVLSALKADGIVGCNPLVAPSSFPVAVRCWGLVEGWGRSAPHPTSIMNCLLTLAPADQRKLCLHLKPEGVWYALTWATTLDPAVKAKLAQRGSTS